MNRELVQPAQLWLGSHNTVTEEVTRFLQRQFCPQSGCTVCTPCRQIREQQHHAVVWICPEKNYTLDALQVIQERIAFALNDKEHCFFILQKADFLTTQCANSLLKSIEEPPYGYHFILCADREEYILPTIASRCIIKRIGNKLQSIEHQMLYAYFIATKAQQPAPFLKEIQECTLTENQSLDLTDQLLAYWMNQYTDAAAIPELQQSAKKRIDLFKEALLMPPMPGSTKLFWKNLFLMYHTTIS